MQSTYRPNRHAGHQPGFDAVPQFRHDEDESQGPGIGIPSPKGMRLSGLLAMVERALAAQFGEPVWVQAEIVELKKAATGHVYLDLIERDTDPAAPRAKVRAMIWKTGAHQMLQKFAVATGMQIRTGMNVLLRAKVTFSGVYGLSLTIVDIDPNFTVGAMAAHMAAVRKRLREEQLFDRNRALPQPVDFRNIAVIAPDGAAGLGDFKREADKFQNAGVIRFHYFAATFQGDRTSPTITRAFAEIHQGRHFDAIVVLRGGGGTADLQYLNDYAIARAICCARFPVIVGVGHEKDKTILDEVACVSLGTPSKIIGYIAGILKRRMQSVRDAMSSIELHARQALSLHNESAFRCLSEIRLASDGVLAHRRQRSDRMMIFVRNKATEALSIFAGASHEKMNAIQIVSRGILDARSARAQRMYASVQADARAGLERARRDSRQYFLRIQQDSVNIATLQQKSADQMFAEIRRRSNQRLEEGSRNAEALFREIFVQRPEVPLTRGYAYARDSAGKIVVNAEEARKHSALDIVFADGSINIKVRND